MKNKTHSRELVIEAMNEMKIKNKLKNIKYKHTHRCIKLKINR